MPTYRLNGKFVSRDTYLAAVNKAANPTTTQQVKVTTPTAVPYALTLSNGLVLSGTKDEVMKLAKLAGHTFDETMYYESKTKGLVKIAEMQEDHLKNVVALKFPDYVRALKAKTKTGKEFVAALSDMSTMLSTDKQLLAMIRELNKRG